ncbi:MAG TPA: hypothetical protein VGI39_37630 [Polyangiaceae bacterium]
MKPTAGSLEPTQSAEEPTRDRLGAIGGRLQSTRAWQKDGAGASSLTMPTRFCVIPDPIYPGEEEPCDLNAYFTPEDPELPIVLGSTGIESTPVFETRVPFEQLLKKGFPNDSKKTADRVRAAPGYAVSPEPDPDFAGWD